MLKIQFYLFLRNQSRKEFGALPTLVSLFGIIVVRWCAFYCLPSESRGLPLSEELNIFAIKYFMIWIPMFDVVSGNKTGKKLMIRIILFFLWNIGMFYTGMMQIK